VGDGRACAGAALSAATTSMTPADDNDGFDQGQARRVVKALVNYGNLLFDVRGDVVSAEECLREAVPFSLSPRPSLSSLSSLSPSFCRTPSFPSFLRPSVATSLSLSLWRASAVCARTP
ncbi:MAG: hypothetical protein ACPIOQ_35300, partial [Promethearchaeia archaeon]